MVEERYNISMLFEEETIFKIYTRRDRGADDVANRPHEHIKRACPNDQQGVHDKPSDCA